MVARLGGDEFAILMRSYQHDDAVLRLADRLLQTLAEPYALANAQISSSASIGITTSAIGYADAEAVLRDADIAMYRAKARWALFDVSLHAQVPQRLRLEGALRPSPTSRCCGWRTTASPASKHWRAGLIPSTARSAPTSSSRSPRSQA